MRSQIHMQMIFVCYARFSRSLGLEPWLVCQHSVYNLVQFVEEEQGLQSRVPHLRDGFIVAKILSRFALRSSVRDICFSTHSLGDRWEHFVFPDGLRRCKSFLSISKPVYL